MQALTISELERATGVPRSTIYFYVREGLVPPGQKAAASRAIYSDVHVGLLDRIKRMQDEGLALDEIRSRLASLIEAGGENGVDLVAQVAEKTRQAILGVAARHFAAKGYKRTRISDIIKEVGISPPAFYNHFRTKRQLLMESFSLSARSSVASLEPELEAEADPVVRLIRRIGAYYNVQALSPGHLPLCRSEALIEDTETRKVAQDTYREMIQGILSELTHLRSEGGASTPPIPDELMAFSLQGALEHTVMRAEWDDKYAPRDVAMTHVHLFLAVASLYAGELDLRDRLWAYDGLADEVLGASSARPDASSGAGRAKPVQ